MVITVTDRPFHDRDEHQIDLLKWQITEEKVELRGKFFYQGDRKFYIRGVTYGAFRPDKNGREYTDINQIDRDFAMMAANGINTVRIPHTTPPTVLLDIAHKHRLKVMIGLSAEQYVGYLIDREKSPDIMAIIREKVKSDMFLIYGLLWLAMPQ